MADRRGSRFVLEVLFLLALAVALTLTDLTPVEIAGVMLIGWIVVALFEWAAWRDEPHYGSGLPPRYYVPQVNLPPAQPLERVSGGYPEARDEAPTWIASPALRAEMLGEWPSAAPPVSEDPAAEPVPALLPTEPPVLPLPLQERVFDPWMAAEELPLAPLGELAPGPEQEAEPEPEAEPQREMEPEPQREMEPEPVLTEAVPSPLVPPLSQPSLLQPPLSQPPLSQPLLSPPAIAEEPAPEIVQAELAQPEPVAAATEPETESVPDDVEPSLEVELTRSVQGVARYSLDPLADPQPKRRFGRSAPAEQDGVEVPARPEGVRPLPGRSNRQD